METYRTEEDQIDAIKRWWEKNGKFLIIGLIFVFAGVVGGGVWRDYEQNAQFVVSNEFDAMMEELRTDKVDEALKRGGQLVDKNKDSYYAIMTSLAMAKLEVEKDNLDAAKLRLTWALENNKQAGIEHIIRLRLIRVLIASDKLNEALTHALKGNASDFSSEYAVVKGDIYRAQGEFTQARNSYQLAMQSDGATPQTKQIIQLKLDDLGDSSTPATTTSSVTPAPTLAEETVADASPVEVVTTEVASAVVETNNATQTAPQAETSSEVKP